LSGRLNGWPAFVRELDATLSVHSQYILSGNLYDNFLLPGADEFSAARLLPLHDLLWDALQASGYACLLVYDPVDGLRVLPDTDDEVGDAAAAAAERLLGKLKADEKPSLEALAKHLRAVVRPEQNLEVLSRPAVEARRRQRSGCAPPPTCPRCGICGPG
jgi:hypothetical protein